MGATRGIPKIWLRKRLIFGLITSLLIKVSNKATYIYIYIYPGRGDNIYPCKGEIIIPLTGAMWGIPIIGSTYRG